MSSNTSDSLQYWLGLQQDVNYATQLHPGHKTICILWLIAALSPITALLYIISLVKRHRTGRLWQSRTFREGYLSPQAAFTIPALQVACSTVNFFWLYFWQQDFKMKQCRGRSEVLHIIVTCLMLILGWLSAWAAVYNLPPSRVKNSAPLSLHLKRITTGRQPGYKSVIINFFFLAGVVFYVIIAVPWALYSSNLTEVKFQHVQAFNKSITEIISSYQAGLPQAKRTELANLTTTSLHSMKLISDNLFQLSRIVASVVSVFLIIHIGIFLWASRIVLLALRQQTNVIRNCFANRKQLIDLEFSIGSPEGGYNFESHLTVSRNAMETSSTILQSGMETNSDAPLTETDTFDHDHWVRWWLPSIRTSTPDVQSKIWHIPRPDEEEDWLSRDRDALTQQYHILRRYTANTRCHVALVVIVGSSYVVLCIAGATNAFKIPYKMAPNTFMLIMIYWFSCGWNIPAFILGVISCLRAFTAPVSFPKEPSAAPTNFGVDQEEEEYNMRLERSKIACVNALENFQVG